MTDRRAEDERRLARVIGWGYLTTALLFFVGGGLSFYWTRGSDVTRWTLLSVGLVLSLLTIWLLIRAVRLRRSIRRDEPEP